MEKVTIIGAGLAGCEAAWQIAKRNIMVDLYEMKSIKRNDIQHLDTFAELVCSNSLRSNVLTNAVGLLKQELRSIGSLIMESADANALPAGSALAVDRTNFSQYITDKIHNHPLIHVIDQEVETIPEGIVVIACGPLVEGKLAHQLQQLCGNDAFHFYDAVAPIVSYDSINMDVAYRKSRYDKGDGDYINCPFDKDQFDAFYQALMEAPKVEGHESIDQMIFFDGCMPFEEMARRGVKTLLFGPMKPVGLIDPRTGKRPYAVVQLRQDDAAGSLYNIVGFQTRLTWSAQKQIVHMIPGLENAQIVRYGVMHRNTYINSAVLLDATYALKSHPHWFVAGQISGVEGYVESCASGALAGINAALIARNMEPVVLPSSTMMGAMAHYITHANPHYFQPMNANFGLLEMDLTIPKNKRKEAAVAQALDQITVLNSL